MQAKGPQLRETIRAAMLRACGEDGYRAVTVQRLLDAYGGNRAQLYAEFTNLEACYLEAYELETERLCAEMLAAGAAAPDWAAGLRAALEALAAFVETQPLRARALVTEVHLAGEAALAMRNAMLERLSGAVDSARHETRSRHSPPPLTALFMVGTIEAAVVAALAAKEPRRFTDAVPELTALVCAAYFGEPDEPGQT
jgi:AcrR family transcriptional regulator